MGLVPPGLSRARACALLGLSRSHSYQLQQVARTEPARSHAALRERLEALCLRYPRYGYRRLARQLAQEGYVSTEKQVRRLMAEEQLQCRRKRRKGSTTDSRHA